MSTTKVSALAALATAADDDVLLISDVSESVSKKITVANLVGAPVSTAVAALVDSAPATLDTLNELAAALGDDANFSTTVTTSIGTKWTQDNTKISNWDIAYSWGNHASAGYLTTETNDLTAAVTWANVPDANITQSSVTQHQAALSITEGQISDLGGDIVLDSDIGVTVQAYNANLVTYATNGNTAYGWGDHASAGYLTGITGQSIKNLSDVYSSMTPSDGQFLVYDTTNGWQAETLAVESNSTSEGLYEHSYTISANYSITSGNNALSAGPVTVATGVSVTIPTGSVWTIV